jgi:hypothetical protein
MLRHMREHHSSAGDLAERQAGARIAAAVLAVTLVAAWLAIYLLWPIPFWAAGDDCVFLSLAHALHFDAVLHGAAPYADEALVNHPGIPFYVASWLAWRCAALFAGDRDIVAGTMADPAAFFLATRIFAGLMTGAAVFGVWRLMQALAPPWRALAILAAFAATPMSLRYGLTILGNETFALPLAVLLFWALRSVVTAPPGAIRPWLLLGVVAGLGYTVKLLYLDMLVAACAVAVVDAWGDQPRIGWRFIGGVVRRGALTATGFLGAAGIVLLAVLGRSGLIALLTFHAAIALHQGSYGTGDSGVVSAQLVYDALANRIVVTAAPYLLGMALVLLPLVLAARRRAGSLDRALALWATAALAAMIAAAAVVLKHYNNHNVIAVGSLLPFALAPILARPGLRWVAGAGIAGGICLTVWAGAGEFAQEQRDITAATDDASAIAALPLLPGEARLWTYGVRSETFAAAFVAQYSGVRSVIAAHADPGRQDFSSYSRVDRPYRYIVVDRAHYPDADAVRRQTGSLEPTQGLMVRLEPDDTIHVLKRLIVIERAAR